MRRGEVWWANLPAPGGRKPVVLVSRDDAYAVRELVVVVPVSTRVRSIPTEVPLGAEDGLPRTCVANADTIVTIPKRTLQERIAPLGAHRIQALDDAIRFALGLES